MWSSIVEFLIGISAGVVVAFAVLALATGVGLYPCLIDKTHTAKKIYWYETVAQIGVVTGSLVTVFDVELYGCSFMLPILGIFIGIYVGCFLMALAEVLKGFPIAFRRFKVKQGLTVMIFFVALGKVCGSLLYFAKQMWK